VPPGDGNGSAFFELVPTWEVVLQSSAKAKVFADTSCEETFMLNASSFSNPEPTPNRLSRPTGLTAGFSARSLPGNRPRKLSYQAGRALEILGHAIDYLGDEYALECRSRENPNHGKAGPVLAIEVLKARSREIYLEGDLIPSLAERFRFWLGFARA
jgi:hypothetical protein